MKIWSALCLASNEASFDGFGVLCEMRLKILAESWKLLNLSMLKQILSPTAEEEYWLLVVTQNFNSRGGKHTAEEEK